MAGLPALIGIDWGSSPSETVVTIGGRQGGKSETRRRLIEQHLDAGHTVYDAATGEVRGSGAARDVTPTLVTKS